MSSIAYIVDRKMIDYHRLRGNKTMNFWRLKTSKNFADFNEGDLLFFLAKKTERNKEKGIIGHGQLSSTTSMGLNKMWTTFNRLNGYETKEELEKAIIKITKDKKVPSSMSCLLLDNVVFFQSPIYISDLGYKISKSLESYIYLDKIDNELTTKILQRAKEDGLDMWTMLIYNHEDPEAIFDQVVVSHALGKVQVIVKDNIYGEYDDRRVKKIINKFMNDNSEYRMIQGSRQNAFCLKEGELSLIFALINDKTVDEKLKLVVGQFELYCRYIEKYYPYNVSIKGYCINSKQELIDIYEIVERFIK